MEILLYVVLAAVAAYAIYRFFIRKSVNDTYTPGTGYSSGGSGREPGNNNVRNF
jgi:hypothetical protein